MTEQEVARMDELLRLAEANTLPQLHELRDLLRKARQVIDDKAVLDICNTTMVIVQMQIFELEGVQA